MAIRRKTPTELRRQTRLTERHTSVDHRKRKEHGKQSYVPVSAPDDIYELSSEELQRRYPERYRRYKRNFASMRRSAEQPADAGRQRFLSRKAPGERIDPGIRTEAERIRDLKWLKMVNGLDAMVHRYSGLERTVNDDGVPVFVDPETGGYLQSRPEKLTVEGRIPAQLELRPLQADAAEAALKHFEKGHLDGYFELPTGFGKTILFIKLLETMKGKGLIVVPTKDLVTQTRDKIAQFAPHLDTKIIMSGAKKAEKGIGDDVTIITYDSFVAKVASGEISADMFDLNLYDEVHELTAQTRSDAFEDYRMNDYIDSSISLGFSATPGYDDDERHASRLMEHLIFGMTLQEAIDANMLSDYQNVVAEFDGVDLAEVKLNSSGEYDEAELARVVDFRQRDKYAAAIYKKYFEGKPTYAFCENITRSRAAAVEFNMQLLGDEYQPPLLADSLPGEERIDFDKDPTMEELQAVERGELRLMAVPYHSEMSKEMLTLIWKLYTSGKVPVLTNVNKCITGNDHPPAEVALNLRPMRSQVAIPQRGGRVLRKFGDKFAYVVDILFTDSKRGSSYTFDQIANPERAEKQHRRITRRMIEEAEEAAELFDELADVEPKKDASTDDKLFDAKLAADVEMPDVQVDLDIQHASAEEELTIPVPTSSLYLEDAGDPPPQSFGEAWEQSTAIARDQLGAFPTEDSMPNAIASAIGVVEVDRSLSANDADYDRQPYTQEMRAQLMQATILQLEECVFAIDVFDEVSGKQVLRDLRAVMKNDQIVALDQVLLTLETISDDAIDLQGEIVSGELFESVVSEEQRDRILDYTRAQAEQMYTSMESILDTILTVADRHGVHVPDDIFDSLFPSQKTNEEVNDT